MMRGHRFADQAEQWIGSPFQWQGRVRVGCDCKGLLAGVAGELGFPEASSLEALCGDYGAIVPVSRLKAGLARLFDKATERQRGDILLVAASGIAQHLCIAAPLPGMRWRTIEALHTGPKQVIAFRREKVVSIWRWRD